VLKQSSNTSSISGPEVGLSSLRIWQTCYSIRKVAVIMRQHSFFPTVCECSNHY